MTDIICNDFKSYIMNAENIFDIMAVACKTLAPYEPRLQSVTDAELKDMVKCYYERDNMVQALADLRIELIDWIEGQRNIDSSEVRGKLFYLVRLIDNMCGKDTESSLPEPYHQYFSLNDLHEDEIIILPKYESGAIDLLSDAISKSDTRVKRKGHGFYNRNYAKTADISGKLHNFIIYHKGLVRPSMNIPNYHKEIRYEFERNGHKIKVGVFPLSNINLKKIFRLREDEQAGLFSIESCNPEQENILLERCKMALKICKNECVDIVVFPEMLFTEKNQDAIIDFVKENQEEGRFPWFIWMGTSWADRENKCMVIDQYGRKVFEQKKHVPYEYTNSKEEELEERKTDDGVISMKKITFTEDLALDKDWVVNFIDIPNYLRIATAICRDISHQALTDSIKELYSDMVVIPAFSGSDRLTAGHIYPLVREKIIALVCNACSALCTESQGKLVVDEQMIGEEHKFCYLCMPAKNIDDNVPDCNPAKYSPSCVECDKYCEGYIWEISFLECVKKGDKIAAKVI